MSFFRMLFLENYWFISQIFKIVAIFTYTCTVILFGRFLLEIAVAVQKIIKICRKISKKSNLKQDENDAGFI